MVLQFPIGTGICAISGFVCFTPVACRAVIASMAVILPVRNAARAVAGLGIIKLQFYLHTEVGFAGSAHHAPSNLDLRLRSPKYYQHNPLR